MYGSARGAPGNGRPYRDRRTFITLAGGAVAGWPFEARAEQAPRKRPLLGYLITGTKDGLTHSVSAFLSRDDF